MYEALYSTTICPARARIVEALIGCCSSGVVQGSNEGFRVMSWRFVCNQRAPCPMWIVEPLSAHRHGLLQYVLHIPLESMNQVLLAQSGVLCLSRQLRDGEIAWFSTYILTGGLYLGNMDFTLPLAPCLSVARIPAVRNCNFNGCVAYHHLASLTCAAMT